MDEKIVGNVVYKPFVGARHFGVEMECNEKIDRVTIGDIVKKADPARSCSVTGWNQTGDNTAVGSKGWHVKTDSTCADKKGNYGYEVASYKAQGQKDISNIGNVADALEHYHIQVNDNCGLHVHVEIADFTVEKVGILLAYWCKVEWLIAQALPLHRRKNQYCQLMRDKFAKLDFGSDKWTPKKLFTAMQPTDLQVNHNLEKRVAINLVNWSTGQVNKNYPRKTVELRLPEGTFARDDVENWARFFVHFVEECNNKDFPSLKEASFEESFAILGLDSYNRYEVFLLDKPLFCTKVWLLKRILKYTTKNFVFKQALETLNKISSPLESFVEIA